MLSASPCRDKGCGPQTYTDANSIPELGGNIRLGSNKFLVLAHKALEKFDPNINFTFQHIKQSQEIYCPFLPPYLSGKFQLQNRQVFIKNDLNAQRFNKKKICFKKKTT